jgi:LPS sulfotransferase NodH
MAVAESGAKCEKISVYRRCPSSPIRVEHLRYTELQISSELLDQAEFTDQPKKILICSTPRSGSYLLCRQMINAGLGIPHEYFNPIVMRQMAPRLGLENDLRGLTWSPRLGLESDLRRRAWWRPRGWKDRLLAHRRRAPAAELAFLRKYLHFLLTRRCQGGIFAAKVHFRDYRKTLANPVGDELLKDTLFIQLYREDMLKQAVSEHFAQLTGQWGIDQSVTTTPAANPNFLDPGAVDRAVNDLADQDRGWRVFFARRGIVPLSISYERLSEDPFSFVELIARGIGLDPARLRRGYSETAPGLAGHPALPSKDDVADHYLATMASRRSAASQT